MMMMMYDMIIVGSVCQMISNHTEMSEILDMNQASLREVSHTFDLRVSNVNFTGYLAIALS